MFRMISVVTLVTLVSLITFQPSETFGREQFRSLALVKKLASSSPYNSGLQLMSSDPLYGFDHTSPFDWRVARNPFHDSLNYLAYLERLVKKKATETEDENQEPEQEPKRDGNRKFQTQGWRR
ncbi:uncharacterized protein LOC143238780 [Tachypleus tridentatus]|uniref:uncharacterized protein LOC143238780 n=1 Tax=Tachypleus tridentatus TaxID=6853 RepID=UPI003FD0E052